jgi:hypothetical protein
MTKEDKKPDPRVDEANGVETKTVKWRDFEFEVPVHRADWSAALIEAVEEDYAAVVVREFMGPVNWRRFKALCLTGRELSECQTAIAEQAFGVSSGE